MTQIICDYKYRSTHEWVKRLSLDSDIYMVGITDYAQNLIGDIVFIELPVVSTVFNIGEDCAVAESVKTASSIYAPLTGKIIEINMLLNKNPELVNIHPYDQGWIFKIESFKSDEVELLLDAVNYQNIIK
ncbi:MAG: glycine cleavage system protein GcvH [Candidatus Dasytiphilus stammeri]